MTLRKFAFPLLTLLSLSALSFAVDGAQTKDPPADPSSTKPSRNTGTPDEAKKGTKESRHTILALADVHGDFETFLDLLRESRVVDEAGNWSGSDTHLVQLGDLLDRGEGSRQAMDLLRRLEGEAEKAGGRIIGLLGNHEVMNLVGDLNYVLYAEFGAYAGEEDQQLRALERERILQLVEEDHSLLRSSYYRELGRTISSETFDQHFPPGYFAHRKALSPDGTYGKWLLSKPFVYIGNRTLFCHAGLSSLYGLQSLDSINKQIHAALREFFEATAELERLGVFRRSLSLDHLLDLIRAEQTAGEVSRPLREPFRRIHRALGDTLYAKRGPIWFRGFALGPERVLRRDLLTVLEYHDCDRMIAGHTQPRSKRVSSRFGGRFILLDTGMNQAVYNGVPSVLQVLPDGRLGVLEKR